MLRNMINLKKILKEYFKSASLNRSLMLLALLFSIKPIMGQDSLNNKIGFTAGYFGETVTHAGMNVGIEHYPHQSDRHQMILAGNVGGYVHPRNNTSLFIRAQWGQRLNFKSGLFLDQFIGLGYLHQFVHGGDLYEVKPNGAVVKTPDSGQPLVMPSISLGTGYDFSKTTAYCMKVYLRPELFWKAPFNGYYLTHFALTTGLIINL